MALTTWTKTLTGVTAQCDHPGCIERVSSEVEATFVPVIKNMGWWIDPLADKDADSKSCYCPAHTKLLRAVGKLSAQS